jgi:hypothetical protein
MVMGAARWLPRKLAAHKGNWNGHRIIQADLACARVPSDSAPDRIDSYSMPSRRLRPEQPLTDRRTPRDRLAALLNEKSRGRKRRLMSKIRTALMREPEPAPWIAAAISLRDQGTLTDDAAAYFTDIFLECITDEAAETDRDMLDIFEEIDEIARAHGLTEDDYWTTDREPPEVRALNDQWERRANEINGEYLRAHGHEEYARLVESNDAEWEARTSRGFRDVWGEDAEEAFRATLENEEDMSDGETPRS